MSAEPFQEGKWRVRWGCVPLIAVGVLSLLVALLAVAAYLHDAEHHIAELDLRNLQEAVRIFHHKHGRFPTTDEGFHTLVRENILQGPPRDPWGGQYLYRLDDGVPVITTLGADRTKGGGGRAEDLSAYGAGQ